MGSCFPIHAKHLEKILDVFGGNLVFMSSSLKKKEGSMIITSKWKGNHA